jgi:hypothetical protein
MPKLRYRAAMRHVGFRISETTADQIEAECSRRGWKFSRTCRVLLRLGLEHAHEIPTHPSGQQESTRVRGS